MPQGNLPCRVDVRIAICTRRNFLNHFREAGAGANWTALPEFFKKHGYWTTGSGKLYHHNLHGNFDIGFGPFPAHSAVLYHSRVRRVMYYA